MKEEKNKRRALRYARKAQRLYKRKKYDKSQGYFLKSLRILEPLANENPQTLEAVYADVCYKYAVSRGGDVGRFKKAYYLALRHPDDEACKKIVADLFWLFGEK